MPRIVDHAQRRAEIVDATWRIIERRGFDGVSMREIAAEAGFANGALSPYFRDKDEILEAAFARVTEQTMARVKTTTRPAEGLSALRNFCLEIMPIDETKTVEARIVIAFWDRALHSTGMRLILERTWDTHRQVLEKLVTAARLTGEISTSRTDSTIVDTLTWFMTGLQSRVLFTPHHASPSRQLATLDMLIDALRRDPSPAVAAGPEKPFGA